MTQSELKEARFDDVPVATKTIERSRRWAEGWAPFGFYACTAMFVAGGVFAAPWMLAGGFAALVAGLVGLAAGQRSDDGAWSLEKGSVGVRDGKLFVERGTGGPIEAPLESVESGTTDEHGRVVLRLETGVEIAAALPSESRERLLRAAGVAPGGRAAAVPMGSAWSQFARFAGAMAAPGGSLFGSITSVALPLMISLFGMGAGVAASEFIRQGKVVSGVMSPIIASLVLFAYWGFCRLRKRRSVRVGADGVAIQGAFGKRFVPWSQIRSVRDADEGGTILHLSDSTSIELPRAEGGDAMMAQLTAWRQARVTSETGTIVSSLDRGSKTAAQWREHLDKLVAPGDDYRAPHLEEDQLASVVGDPEAPPDRRVGAALVLSKMSDSAKDRIRIAVDACADTQMKAMLERAAEGEIEEEALETAEKRARA